MRLTRCSPAGCPAVYDPEDGSGDLIIVGYGPLTPQDVTIGNGEVAVRIPRAVLEYALSTEAFVLALTDHSPSVT